MLGYFIPQSWALRPGVALPPGAFLLDTDKLSAIGSDIVTSGNGAPAFTPTGGVALYIQKDSVPPGIIWEYYDGAWHST